MRAMFAGLLLLVALNTEALPWYASSDNFRGAQLMSPEERKTHLARLQNMQSFDECRTYMQAHYLELDKRAKQKNMALEPIQGDPCEAMRVMGHFH